MENEPWLNAGKRTIQKFIETSTRLTPEKVDLTLQEYINFAFRIRLHLGLKVTEQQRSQAGYVSANENRQVFTNASGYSQALKAERSAVLSRTQTLHDTKALVLSKFYGEIRKETVVYSHPRQLCHTDDCDNCHGRGRVNCNGCSGSGKNSCHGCGGSGQVTEQQVHYDHYTKQNRYENVYRSCSSCYGSGKITCRSCGGSGHLSCNPCNGTGVISKITQLLTMAVPDYQLVFFSDDIPHYIKDGLYKTGLPDIEQAGNIALISSEINEDTRSVDFLFDADVPFARLDSPLPQTQTATQPQTIHWIIYGNDPQILDSGHVIERMLKNDLDELVYASKTPRLLNPFIGLSSRKTVHTFMESESHQQMLQANTRGVTGKLLSEHLNRGLSEPYIAEALNSLSSVTRAMQNWSVVKWIIVSSLITWLLMPFFTAWQHAWFSSLDTGRSYLTPLTRWGNQQNILFSLQMLGRYCGLFAVALGVIIPALGYGWRRLRTNQFPGGVLLPWGLAKGLLRSRWLFSLSASLLLSGVLLALFPVWLSPAGALFDTIPFSRQAMQIMQFFNHL